MVNPFYCYHHAHFVRKDVFKHYCIQEFVYKFDTFFVIILNLNLIKMGIMVT